MVQYAELLNSMIYCDSFGNFWYILIYGGMLWYIVPIPGTLEGEVCIVLLILMACSRIPTFSWPAYYGYHLVLHSTALCLSYPFIVFHLWNLCCYHYFKNRFRDKCCISQFIILFVLYSLAIIKIYRYL